MADAAVTFLLENLNQLLKYHVDLIAGAGAEAELEQLKVELALLKAFLEEEAVKPKEARFSETEGQIREVVYEMEDTMDTFLTQVAASKVKRTYINPLRATHSVNHRNLAREIKSLREDKVKPMLDKLRMAFSGMQIGEGSSRGAKESLTTVKKIQLIRDDNVVGFKDEEETIIKYLKEEKEEIDVISITGMPGQGKTTLAWKIFQNEEIKYEFPVRIWVYVSQDFNPRDVFLNILKGFTKQDLSGLSDRDLIQTQRAYLESGKFLLVMDDVWTNEAWTTIKYALPMRNRMGKVLITSPDGNVCMHANVTRKPHKLRFLYPDESWELLQLEVFGKLNECPQELQEIGKDIARQCDGLPLSIVVVGGLLVEQNANVHAWRMLSKNVTAYFGNHKLQSTSDILALSYKNLPGKLRDCFLYLGVFPEDYEIPVWTLTRLWIAEGFIQHEPECTLEETAEGYLKDLINKNLVMVEKTEVNGEVKTCRVHDVIREFCKSKAAIGDQNLFQEIKKHNGVFQPPISDIEKYRRICIHSHLSEFLLEFLTGKLKGPRVRSLLCFYKERTLLDPKYLSTIPDSFNLLRVLDSKSIIFYQFPPKVTRLIHLRYLTLSSDDLSVLPASLSSLWNLQTLVVETKSRILEIKASIWKMIRLRHLKTRAEIILAIQDDQEGRGVENLQTLSRLSPKYCTPDVLKRVRNLKRFGVRGDLAILLEHGRPFEHLDHLETLKLKHDLPYQTSKNPLRGLPSPYCFPPYIRRLTLSSTFLDWEHMSTLAMIRNLEVLKLKDNAFMGISWTIDAGFPHLQFLLIEKTDLVIWEASYDHFPNLVCLVLNNCARLSNIPLVLAKSLQILNIERVALGAVESARKIEVEKKRMQGENQGMRGRFKLQIGPGC